MNDVRIHDKDHVRTIVMDRPAKKNALSHALAWGVVTAVQQAAHDDDVRVIALTGSGDAFCSGLDLAGPGEDVSPLPPQERAMDDISWVGRFLLVLRQECDKPVVAGVNGVAAGAGLSLAMAADMRLMAKSARLIAGYPRIGASPDGGLSWTLPRAIGYEQAMRFLLENRTVGADEARHLGMVGEVVDDAAFEARLAEYCALLAERSPIASRFTKRVVAQGTRTDDLAGHLRYELATIRRAFATEDHREARQAFLEKRAPIFRGR
ncbi:MAG: enoyl-CoA hydratase/isomerase family protein [Candidatus Rokubacteria bacterium]|nr:enoyl-CoA hydratase/isomerase family protein [Candidatus Rokubacteria bacterium]